MSNKLNMVEVKKEALLLLLDLVEDFPGLLDDETEVNGADLVERLSQLLERNCQLKDFLEA